MGQPSLGWLTNPIGALLGLLAWLVAIGLVASLGQLLGGLSISNYRCKVTLRL
jgi:hypothetical protein